jgi:ComF family protein
MPTLLNDFFWLIYPQLCASCDNPLNSGEDCLCTRCRFQLPKTYFHLDKENLVAKQFFGKVKLHAATSYLTFTKGEKVQHLIHQLKYKGKKEIGIFLGEMLGYDLKRSEMFSDVDVVVPVPLHEKKLRKRGFNQSDCFAEGLSKAMKIPFEIKAMRRNFETETQTKKHRYERFENVHKKFEVIRKEKLKGKHVLLVDDVITTGSTLIACIEPLLELPDTRVSIAAIACA